MMATELPKLPWEYASSDLFEFEDTPYIVLTDHFSGFIEIDQLPDQTTSSVIKPLKQAFCTHGIPKILYHDPGTQYTSTEFKDFSDQWGFEGKPFSATYSQANGRAEKAVQIAKNLLKKAKREGNDWRLALLDYRNTPRDSVLGSPAQRCMGRRTRTRLPVSNKSLEPTCINPQTVTDRLKDYRNSSKYFYDKHSKGLETIEPGDSIRYKTGKTWTPAQLISENSSNPRSFKIKTPSGRVINRNRRHLLKTKEGDNFSYARQLHDMANIETNNTSCFENREQNGNDNIHVNNDTNENLNVPVRDSVVTRSGRTSKPPSYLKDFVS